MESPETSGVQEVEEAAKKTDAPAVGETYDAKVQSSKLENTDNAKKPNTQAVGEGPDAAVEAAKQKQYLEDKQSIIQNISTWKLNTEYKTDNTEYKNKIFRDENPTQVTAYVAYYNTQIAKTNAIEGKNIPLIKVDDFMAMFKKEKKLNDVVITDTPPVATPVNTKKATQEVGEFIDLTPDQQSKIQK